jgi:MOSC domain-containing protein YiiM
MGRRDYLMATIVSIVYTPASVERKPRDHYSRVPLEHARLIEGAGIEGDAKSGSPTRHLNIMAAEMLEQLRFEGFHTAPGEMGEQITVSEIDLASLKPGDRLRLGECATVEVVVPRTGCDRFERIQGQPKGSVKGRLGIIARVVAGGDILVGDSVEVIQCR